ncbi:MAG TPA: hypothetical protein ACFCUY_15400 [Xenococcaceae cyanobacterium]
MDLLHYNLIEVSFNWLESFVFDYTPVLAQTIKDPDILGQMEAAWHNFIESGQVWALVIGLFIGYTFKGFTSY